MAVKGKDRVGLTIKNFKLLDYKFENKESKYLVNCLLCGCEKWMYYSVIKNPIVQGCGCQKRFNDKNRKDLTGQVFGRLTAIQPTEKKNNRGTIIWLCECSCGNRAEIVSSLLISGKTRSCGCFRSENFLEVIKRTQEKVLVEDTSLQNLTGNLSKANKSGIKGVFWASRQKRWKASIGFQGKRIHLGYFADIEDAIVARKEAEDKYFKPVLKKYKDRLSPEQIAKLNKTDQ